LDTSINGFYLPGSTAEAGAEKEGAQKVKMAREKITVRELPARLMRVKDASKYLALSPGSLRGLVQRGELPAVIPGDNAPWLLDVEDLNRWIERHKQSL
jgi:excisionase family DNA binding protein